MQTMRLGRNDLCRCGSGKKFKKCCLARQLAPVPVPPQRGPLPAESGARPASDGIQEYVVVKNKGRTHRRELRPGDECRLKDGSWAIYRPDLMDGGSVLVKDRGWVPERELKPGDQYECNGVWVTFQPERTIGTTEEHPFYVYGKGWTPLREIKVGDLLRTEDGWVPVTKIEDTGRYETVYNLRVADHHTYFVGTRDWGFAVWAHNACNHLLEELGTDAATKAFRNNSRGFRDAVEHAATGDRAAFERVLAADGIKDQATVQRLWDAARKPLDTVAGEVGRVGPGGRLRVTKGLEDLGDPAGSVRITHPTGDDVLVVVGPDGAARIEVGFVNSRGTHNELLAAGVDLAKQKGATSLTYNSGRLNDRSGPLLTAFFDKNRPFLGGGPLRKVSDNPLVYESDMSALLGR